MFFLSSVEVTLKHENVLKTRVYNLLSKTVLLFLKRLNPINFKIRHLLTRGLCSFFMEHFFSILKVSVSFLFSPKTLP